MKYSVGDLLLIKDIEYNAQFRLRLHKHIYYERRLLNSYGIITETFKHSFSWKRQPSELDNVYVWFSQLDGKEYYFCEDEVTGEVFE